MLCAGRSNSFLPYGTPQSPWGFDAFGTQLNQDFELDLPVALSLAVEHAKTRPEEAVVVVATAAGVSESPPMSAKAADALWDALFSAGNLPGNVVGSAETVLRAAFKRQAMKGFATLLAGHVGQPIRLGPHITITPHRIAQDGTLRRGAKLIVRVRGLPLNVLQGLPTPLAVNRGGTVGTARISARHLAQMQTAGHAVADARLNSMRFFRATGTRVGGGVLAFGPSAAIDFYNSARVDNGSLAVDWRGFAVKSAKSQSGNLVGVVAGGVAVAVVGTVGWPVVLLGLGVGIVAQAVWSTTGMDERAAQAADRHLPK